jgi:cell division transport system permease protein
MAWKRFKETYGTSMLSAVDDNPFPASVEISLTEHAQSTESTQALQRQLEHIPGIEEIQISQQWVRFMQQLKGAFFIGSISIAVMLMFALHFMIANTIQLTVYARQDVIRNMRYVGATKLFIRVPFIAEGLLQGIAGGIVALVVLAGTKLILQPHLHIYWGPWYSFLFILFTGALFGCIGSISGVRKFLS